MRCRACPTIVQILVLGLSFAVALPVHAARLIPDRSEVTIGEQVSVLIDQGRTSVNVKWRSSPELRLDEAGPGAARFLAVTPGQGMVMATIDGELTSVGITVAPGEGTLDADTTSQPVRTPAVPLRPLPVAEGRTVSDAPYLRTRLPDSTFAYLRIPNVWGVLGAPSGNLFDQAMQSAPYVDAILGIRSGVLENILPGLPKEWRALANLLLAQLRSPLEVAFMAPDSRRSQFQMPDLLLAADLEQDELTEVDALLDSLFTPVPGLALEGPLKSDGSGLLLAGGVPIEIFFDAAQRRLFLGFATGTLPLAQRVAALRPTPDHPLHGVEKELDESGQGLFLWLAPTPLLQLAEGLGKAGEVALLRAFGAAEVRSLALGMGGSGGKQRIKLLLDMPQVGFRNFFPVIDIDLPFKAAGTPETILMFGLPGPEDLARLEGSLQPLMSPSDYQEYQAAKAQLPELLGLTAEQFLDTFGHELLLIHDQAGYYAALRLRDPTAYQTLLQQLVQGLGLSHETRDLLGTTFHHLTFSPLAPTRHTSGLRSSTIPDTAAVPDLEQRLFAHPSHLYWIEHQGYLVFAEVPQVLMDILYIGAEVPVDHWLRQAQGVDPSGTLLLGSTRTTGVPQLVYKINLWLLTYLGDLVGRPVDLFSLPSAYELQLPTVGAYSVQLTSSPDQLSLEMVYESNPLEGLVALGGIQMLMTAGIAAAIAIPSYLEFVETTPDGQFQDSMDSLRTLEGRLHGFYRSNARFPSADEVDAFLKEGPFPEDADLRLEPDTGRMVVRFYGEGLEGGNELILAPRQGHGEFRWQCEGTLNVWHIPPDLCSR